MKILRFTAVAAVVAFSLGFARPALADHWGGWHGGPRVSVGFGYGGYGYGYGPYRYPYYAPYYYGPYYGPGYVYGVPSERVYVGRRVYSDDSVAVDVQRKLARLHYYRGAIDGEIGSGSRAAIREYQGDHSLPATGRIDDRLLRSLGL